MTTASIVVAGHLCLDVIPAIPPAAGGLADLLHPGKLVDVGPATVATGGAVSNTGQALHRLGADVRLAALVGDDAFGDVIRARIDAAGDGLSRHIRVEPGLASSYSVVVNVPGYDRIFLHCPGANDTFDADTPGEEVFDGAGWFHFGYPPLMRRMFEGEGRELERLFARARRHGLRTSLDMALPDPASEAGRAPWPAILRRVLPLVDVFCPSFDEIVYMLDGKLHARPDLERVRRVGETLLEMGTEAVLMKLGGDGLYFRDGSVERYTPCFRVELAGGTGAGDCTIAGFLYGRWRGFSTEACLRAATAAGACCVERLDATSGVRPWAEVEERLAGGWSRQAPAAWLPAWEADVLGVFHG